MSSEPEKNENGEPKLCFISGKSGDPLTDAKTKGRLNFERMVAELGDDIVLGRMKVPTLRYDQPCKLGLFNASKLETRKRKSDDSETHESRKKRRRTGASEDGVRLLYKNKCILCNETVKLYLKNPEHAKKLYSKPDSVSKDILMKQFLRAAEDRLAVDDKDQWAIEVKGRLLGISDLVAEEALLHKLCSTKFLSSRNLVAEEGGGRKIDDDRQRLLEMLFQWLDDEMENNLFTLEEVHEQMKKLDWTEDKSLVYSKRYLKDKIVEKYEDQVYFTSQERRKDVLCFKDSTANIIREYHENNNEEDEKTKIIKTAVKFIQNDISLAVMNKSYYPSLLQMTDLEHQLSMVPESLKIFLLPLVKTEKRVAAWGQSIIKTCRPRSGVLPHTLRFALQLDHRFGSKWLIDELHNLGLCESYQEVGNYKYCYLRNKLKLKMKSSSLPPIEEHETEEEVEEAVINLELSAEESGEESVAPENSEPAGESTEENVLPENPEPAGESTEENEVSTNSESFGVSLVETVVPVNSKESDPSITNYNNEQYVGDNVDLNIVSINGNKPFHAMGVIKIVPHDPNSLELVNEVPRVRLTPKEKAETLKAGDVPIKACSDPKKSGIDSVKFIPLENLIESVSSVPAKIHHEDIIWAAGWVVKRKDSEFSHANWNGWMKSIHATKNKQPHDIEYQPIIDGDPNDHSTIYTTLLRCIE